MEPVTLAVLTTGVTSLALEVAKGAASEAGRNAWGRIKAMFDWSQEPAEADLPATIAKALDGNEALAREVVKILQAQSTGTASTLVGTINAKNVTVAEKIDTVIME